MRSSSPVFLLSLVVVASCSTVHAQLTVNDAAAALDVNGVTPGTADPTNHIVPINVNVVTVLDLHINSGPNPNVGVILVASGDPIAAPVLPTPWGDSLDIGSLDSTGSITNVALVVDGVAHSTNPLLDPLAITSVSGDYDYTGTVSQGLAALPDPSFAVQAIVEDPAAAPFFFDNTEAGDVTFFVGPNVTSYTLPDDGNVMHSLIIPITFGETSYTQVFINSNGFVTFALGSNDFTETMVDFFGGWGFAGNAGVAVVWSDLNRNGVNSGATYDVVEDSNTGIVACQFNGQNWWSANSPAGSFKAIFNDVGTVLLGGVILDLSGLTAVPSNGDDFIVGVTDGDDASASGIGTDTDLSDGSNTGFVNAIGNYASTGIQDSVGELFLSSLAGPMGANPPSVINFLHLGNFQWVIL